MPLWKKDGPQSCAEEATRVALIWASTVTCPGVANAMRTVAKFCDNPGEAYPNAIVKILRYLRRSKDLEQTYEDKHQGVKTSAYVD